MRNNLWRTVVDDFQAEHVALTIATRSQAEASAQLRTTLSGNRLRLLGDGAAFSARFLAAPELAGLQLSTMAFGTEMELEIEPDERHLLVTAQAMGRSTVLSQGLRAEGGSGFIVIDSSASPVIKRFSADSTRLNLRVPRVRLNRTWTQLTGEPMSTPLCFHPFLFDAQARQRWHAHVRLLMSYGLQAHSTPARLAESMTESVLLAMLLEFPHNHSRRLDAPVARPAASTVERAKAFIAESLHEPLSLSLIARECGVSIRALTAAFAREQGQSVMRYVQEARLQAARLSLMRRQDDLTVAQVAADCGFSGLGRFAAAYRQRFGELPSQTLMRR